MEKRGKGFTGQYTQEAYTQPTMSNDVLNFFVEAGFFAVTVSFFAGLAAVFKGRGRSADQFFDQDTRKK